ncbi:MAG TPA: hypothetical protein VK934_02755, partial [Fimbriimonas sp.]|nr:hypothetical protein [Fimbriimonas sp.]
MLRPAALVAGLVLNGIGVAQGSSNFGLTYRAPQLVPVSPEMDLARWASPSIFTARVQQRGARLSLGGYYSTLEGRSVEAKEAILSFVPTEKLLVWVSKQDYVAKGQRAKSRFRMTADTYGLRYTFNAPDEYGGDATALQLEVFRPSDADAFTGSGGGTFFATKAWTLGVIHSKGKDDYQVAYSNVEGAGSGKSSVFDLGWGRSMWLKEKLKARLQGNLVAQTLDGNGFNNKAEIRPVLFGALSYEAASWLSVEGEVAAMPFGMPVAGGRMTPFTSFQIYNPGGAVANLRTRFV